MNTCRTCKHYTPDTCKQLGSCERWRQGYNWETSKIGANEVVVEGDEGWGAFMGPDFGCVLWEAR